MKKTLLQTIILLAVLTMSFELAQAQTTHSDKQPLSLRLAEFNLFHLPTGQKASRVAFRLMPSSVYSNVGHSRFSLAAAANPVVGSGSVGRLAKWSGVMGTNTFVLGNSAITEDKFGKVGIGTTNPTSPLTVAGLIETVSPAGGIKFADGTIQTTSATGALFSVARDATLMGNGTSIFPLGVAVPLTLNGSVPVFGAIVKISNSANGDGVEAIGGFGNSSPGGNGVIGVGGDAFGIGSGGGDGVIGRGGNSNSGDGGDGIAARGGGTDSGSGGNGVDSRGGGSISDFGGRGVDARGGDSKSFFGGEGLHAAGGDSNSGDGGDGIFAGGGNSILGKGGAGLFAVGGDGPLGTGRAGSFVGDVVITGNLSKGGGSFKVDHPLDPENKYLYHSFVESPDMKNIYDGNVITDANGEATVELPTYFEALNKDFRYQLTVLGTFAQAIVAEEVKGNRFVIRTSAPNVKVSWQVTGIRQDGWANRNRIKVETEKPDRERGYYLHPEAFDQPEERGIEWARHPEMMQQRKEARQQSKQKNH